MADWLTFYCINMPFKAHTLAFGGTLLCCVFSGQCFHHASELRDQCWSAWNVFLNHILINCPNEPLSTAARLTQNSRGSRCSHLFSVHHYLVCFMPSLVCLDPGTNKRHFPIAGHLWKYVTASVIQFAGLGSVYSKFDTQIQLDFLIKPRP